ncbi:hypothetical protein B0T18DRAFT_428653 [Schizothecium vesticola]|uniref:Uncharacterized protein n=1 Tax=Schizothecium vesticola TaxID=314040 RepID=A0AA40EU34_9PEZI|nr:hypothetical protein B0T18DRAFT_428653 [Schizothecium vesticola]
MGHSDSKLAAMAIPSELATHDGLPRRLAATYKKSMTKIVGLLRDPNRPDDDTGTSYAVSWAAGWYGRMTFHSGPTTDHAPLAAARSAGKLGSDFEVTLPALPPVQPQARTETMRYAPSLRREMWWFAMPVGDAGVERFEWRRSRGAEVKEVEGGCGRGWKLVRMGRSNAAAAAGEDDGDDDESADGRPDGRTSDGMEVVAVWADAGLSLSRMGALEFRGSGATGELGLLWSIMAAVTCMCIWQMRQQRNTTAAVSAGVS